MQRTTFRIPKMDCASEEQLVRLKLDGMPAIRNLDFDVPKRRLIVFHDGQLEQIEGSIAELGLGGERLETQRADESEVEEQQSQRKLLWTVLAINFGFFVIEITAGIVSVSMGLVADSLDMLADAFVYGISLFAVGGTATRKRNIARIAGYAQMLLAVVGFGSSSREAMQ